MRATHLHYFASGNTASGYASLLDSALEQLETIIYLKGGPGTGKIIPLHRHAEELSQQGYEVWSLHCASDPDTLDGLIVPALRLGIVNGTTPSHIALQQLKSSVICLDIGQTGDDARLTDLLAETPALQKAIAQSFADAYSEFARALAIHDKWESIYISQMDFARADEITAAFGERLFAGKHQERTAQAAHRFLGAATPRGAVDFVPNLTDGLKRILIKGRPGSGKSTLLKKLAAEAQQRGFDAEIYHCGFDPNSLDMLIVRDLGFAIFDSTAPHEYGPERKGDEILDMYALCIVPGTDERFADQIAHVTQDYADAMKQAIAKLAEASAQLARLEAIHLASLRYDAAAELAGRVRSLIAEAVG